METGGQGEAPGVEEAGPGKGFQVEWAVDGKVVMVRWRSQVKKLLPLKSIYRTFIRWRV